MTALAVGSSATVALRDAGQVTVSTNGGFASVTVTPTAGVAQTVSIGPGPTRRTFGPYTEGATVVISNQTVGALDYDRPGGNVATFSDDGRSLVDGGGIVRGRPGTSLAFASPHVQHKMGGLNCNVGSAAGRTWCGKVALDVAFNAVRLAIYRSDIAGPAVLRAIVAATETADLSDVSTTGINSFQPIVGGASKKAVIDSTTDEYGWRNVTWTSDWMQVDSITQTAGLATVTRAAKHGYSNGDTFTVDVRGANQDTDIVTASNVGSYNGKFAATATSDTAFTFAVLSSTYTPATGKIEIRTKGTKVRVQPATPSFAPLDTTNASFLPAMVYSDWMPVKSTPRADGGTLPLLIYRINVVSGTTSYVGSTTAMETPSASNQGRIFQGLFLTDASGVYVTTPQTWTPTPGGGLNRSDMTVGIDYMPTSGVGVNVMYVGDSITQSTNVSDISTYWGRRACNALSDELGFAVGATNFGASTQTTETYLNSFLLTVDQVNPQVVVYSAFSPNDNGSFGDLTSVAGAKYLFLLAKVRLMRLLSECKKRGIVPIIWTGIPTPSTRIPASSIGVQVNALFKAYNAEVLAIAAAQGAWGVDMFAAMTDGGAGDATYGIDRIPDSLGAEAYPNGLHPDDGGAEAMKAALLPVLRSVLRTI
jgi:lysophospholipase L1-like esterase